MRPLFLLPLAALAVPSPAATKVVLGKLAQTTAAAQIFSAPSASARAVYRIAAGTRLVVRSATPRWAAVVLTNGHLGYVPAQAVEIVKGENGLPYEVLNTPRPTPRYPQALASRGGYVRGSMDARAAMVEQALSLEGSTPYKWGGTQLGSGIDCSGFVQKMCGGIGLNLPRTAAEQALVGMAITRLEDLRPGDRLYFWENRRAKIGHTGIYAGNGYFVHSSSGHKGIAQDFLSERWRRILVAARR